MSEGKTVWLSAEVLEKIEEESEDWMSPNQYLRETLCDIREEGSETLDEDDVRELIRDEVVTEALR